MTEGVRSGGFAAANTYEKTKQPELQKKLTEDATTARHHGETEWQQQIATEKKALEDDKVVSSSAIRELGKGADWNQQRMNDAIARHDQNKDGVFAEDEFDLLAAEMEPGEAKGYTVESGDSLSKMTKETGRDPSRYTELYEANKDVIGNDPNMIHPGQALKKPPTWVVEDAKIDPAKPTHQVPDRQDEMQKAAQIADAETLGQAKQALDEIPEDHPKRAEYEQKVKDLEAAYGTKWAPPAATPPAGGSTPPATDDDAPPTTTTPPAGGAEAPAVDPKVKADYDQMMANPDAARGWDAARQGDVQKYAQQQVEAKLAEAGDKSKSPEDRRKAAEAAEKIATDTINAAERAGYPALAQGLVDEGAKAQQAVEDLKLATGDQKAVEEAIGKADGDPAKLKAIAAALPANDPRAKALTAVADGKVSEEVGEKILDALKDSDSTRGDIADALQASNGDKAAIEALAAVADYKASVQPPETKAEIEALAKSLNTMAKASDQVRQELAKGFDDRGNKGDYERAVDAATSKEDLQALQAFVAHKQITDRGFVSQVFNGQDPGPRLQAAIDNYDALKKSPEAWKQVQNLLHDNRDNDDDLIRAGAATDDPDALRALARLAESVGESNIAANLLELTQPQYRGAAPGTREAVLKRD
jgi:hypothetical protein